jgi:hypothetical protein
VPIVARQVADGQRMRERRPHSPLAGRLRFG